MKEGVTAALTIKHHFYPGHILSTVWDLETQERSLGHNFQAVKTKRKIFWQAYNGDRETERWYWQIIQTPYLKHRGPMKSEGYFPLLIILPNILNINLI